jgi:Ca2+-binding EF-hand superfamily protein
VIREAFDYLDYLGRGYLTINDIKKALDIPLVSGSVYSKRTDIEVEGLIRRFNKDKLGGKISLPEFLEEFEPKYP